MPFSGRQDSADGTRDKDMTIDFADPIIVPAGNVFYDDLESPSLGAARLLAGAKGVAIGFHLHSRDAM